MKFRAKDKPKVRASPDLTPLIDVVFQLLIFFMLSATFVVQTSINVELQEDVVGAEQYEQRDITITLAVNEENPDGPARIYIDQQEFALEDIADQLREIALAADLPDDLQPFVLIRPDRRVTTGRLIELIGILNSLGLQNYGIAADPPGEDA